MMANLEETETDPRHMPRYIYDAAVEGDWYALDSAFGLQEEQRDDQNTPGLSDSGTSNRIEADDKLVKLDMNCVTHFGETILHILVTNGHYEIASLVFQKDASLLKAHNKLLESPLHSAAKSGNVEFLMNLIRLVPSEVKDACGEVNFCGETVSHVAVKHGHIQIFHELEELDPATACKDGKSLLQLAIVKGYTSVVAALLHHDPTLAYLPDSNGVFPAHLAARSCNAELVIHFLKWHPDSGELLDSDKRNVLHIAADRNMSAVFEYLFSQSNPRIVRMVSRMINAMDNEGNTPLHTAAMKGHQSIMISISAAKKKRNDEQEQRNYDGLTPFELSVMQKKEYDDNYKQDQAFIRKYIAANGPYFTKTWFSKAKNQRVSNGLDKIQVVGLGSVLVATAAFAAAFTLPGGYDSVTGTPILARKYAFKAFILADIVAFLQSFISVFLITLSIFTPIAGKFINSVLAVAAINFLSAGTSLVVAFGLGLYVILAPVNLSIAILALVLALLLGLPVFLLIFGTTLGFHFYLVRILRRSANAFPFIIPVAGSLLFIFLLAFL